MFELDSLNLLNAKIDNVVKMLNTHMTNVGSSSSSHVTCCTIYGGNHDDFSCTNEQVQFVSNYNRSPQNNPYSNTYNSE